MYPFIVIIDFLHHPAYKRVSLAPFTQYGYDCYYQRNREDT